MGCVAVAPRSDVDEEDVAAQISSTTGKNENGKDREKKKDVSKLEIESTYNTGTNSVSMAVGAHIDISDSNDSSKNKIDPLSRALLHLNEKVGKGTCTRGDCDVLFLDGGLGTHVEHLCGKGSVSGQLWATKMLVTNPETIIKAHLDYLESGANIITTCSYQASFEGFEKMFNYDENQSTKCLIKSIDLANEAIKMFQTKIKDNEKNKNRNNKENTNKENANENNNDKWLDSLKDEPILIAASVGAYGAHLCDGSEYSGYSNNSNVTESGIWDSHERKMNAIMSDVKDNSNVVFACETVPCIMEMEIICKILNKHEYYGWISMSIKNSKELNCGDLISDAIDCINKCNKNGYCIGIGINCSNPSYMNEIIKLIRNDKKWDKFIIVYPNNGKEFDTTVSDYVDNGKEWSNEKYARFGLEWYKNGANVIGGCCLTTPDTIRCLRKKILESV